MQPLLQAVGQAFTWALKNSVQASVLILLVLLAQWAFRKRLSPGWRHALWLLVLVRLLLPMTPPSPWSVFNLPRLAVSDADASPIPETGTPPRTAVDSKPAAVLDHTSLPTPVVEADGTAAALGEPAVAPAEPLTPPRGEVPATGNSQTPRQALWPFALGAVWLLGALGLLAQVIWSGRRLNAELARQHAVVNPAVGDVLAEAQQRMNVRRVLPVVQSRAVGCPALMGFIRPWLLLPEGVAGRFTPEELRFVFLHELAHLKRRDILVNWLMTAVQILHWFNPLVWLAFSRMRADRELACDAHALGRASASDRQPYGRTMIKLLEGFTRPAVVADLVGILEDPNLMKRRITMIKHNNPKGRWSWLAPVLLCGLGLVALTDAKVTCAASSRPPALTQAGLQRLHQGRGTTQWYAVSPNGKLACYTDWTSGGYGFLNLANGTEVSLVSKTSWTETQDFGHTGAFSPDVRQLAYVWVAEDGHEELRLLDTGTEESRVLLNRPQEDSIEVHDWAPDGGAILVLAANGGRTRTTRGMALVSVDGGRITREFELNQLALSRLRMSPDGRFVAFGHHTALDDREGEVSILDLSNGQVTPLVAHPGEDYPLEWSPGGDRLLFVSDRRGDFDLWEIAVHDGKATGEARLQIPSTGKIEGLGVTSDGALHYSANIELRTVQMMSLAEHPDGKWRLSPTGERLPRAFEGAWSHDGIQFAFFRQDPEQENIKLCVRTGQPVVERTFDTGLPHPLLFGLEWSLDDRAIRYLYKEVKALGIHELVMDKGKPERIDDQMRAISPDGLLIAAPGDGGLELLDRKTGELRQLVKHAKLVNRIRMVFSPSGKHIAYLTLVAGDRPGLWLTDGSTLWVAPVAGGEPKSIFQSEGSIGTPIWLPDEQAVLCGIRPKGEGDAPSKWWRVPCDGGDPEPVELDVNGAKVRSMKVHPDGKQVAVGTNEQWTELWVADGLDLSGGM